MLKNISSIADADSLPTVIASVVTAHLVVSVFLLGGVLDRLARDRATGALRVLRGLRRLLLSLPAPAACSAAAIYWLLFVRLHPLLFDTLYHRADARRDGRADGVRLRVGSTSLFGAVLVAVNVIFDYAKIRMVVEDRRSAIGALDAALRFIARQPGAAVGLYS